MKKRTLTLVISLLLVALVAVGGTLAWLMDKEGPVVNTFTAGDVDITLTEDNVNNDNTPNTNSYKMIPGNTITKNPTITVASDSEPCYVFVKLEKANNFDDYMTYTMNSSWTQLPGVEGVFYRENVTAGTVLQVIHEDKVVVKDTVTKAMMDSLTETTQPTLTVTAYAVQKDNLSLTEAWNVAKGLNKDGTPVQAQ